MAHDTHTLLNKCIFIFSILYSILIYFILVSKNNVGMTPKLIS